MLLEKFYADFVLDGCVMQLGTENTIFKAKPVFTEAEIKAFLATYPNNNLYFLAGIRDKGGGSQNIQRAKDEDILKKNYFYLDLDIRKSHPELTDEKIKTEILQWAKDILSDMGGDFAKWSYIVFTGNGLHIYYHGAPIALHSKENWSAGVTAFMESVEKAFEEKFDKVCVNPARIGRMPGSYNCKNKMRKLVEIVAHQEQTISLNGIMSLGAERIRVASEEAKKKAEEIRVQFPDSGDAYNAIQQLPAGKILCMLTGWTICSDGSHFQEAGKRDQKACFLSKNGNFIVHGGTPHLPPNQVGYRPFELVKNFLKLDNFATFNWFKNNFPEIRKISQEKMAVVTVPVNTSYGISSSFDELRKLEVRQLSIAPQWDDWKLLLRGKVTRIGAMPGTGKSKLGYYLTHLLLQHGYKGLFFSTEVQAAEVIAHLLQIRMKRPALDFLEHKVDVPLDIEEDYRNLKVYDVRHTGNNLAKMEQLIKQENDEAKKAGLRGIDFIVVDFSQQVTPRSGKMREIFDWAREWGDQCQEISQRYEIAFIDVCQLSIKGNKDEDEKYGQVPYEGGNKLHQTADISSMISRDKSIGGGNTVTWDIRKSKAMGRRFRLELKYDITSGIYTPIRAFDSHDDSGMAIMYNEDDVDTVSAVSQVFYG